MLLVVGVGVCLFATKFFTSSAWFEKTTNPGAPSVSILAEHYELTQRETTILALLTEGRSYEEMAEELFIAQGTVRAHVGHIFEKTNTHSRWELEQTIQRYWEG